MEEAAAGGGSLRGLCEEAVCPICLDYFQEPVILIRCGHNFCRLCLARYWEGFGADEAPSCPECREKGPRKFIANRQLAHLAEKLRRLEEEKATERKRLCQKHQEPLKLFCKEEESPICLVCDRSKEHRGHQVVPLEEAAQAYQELITSRLDLLKRERAEITKYKEETEKESQDLLKQTEVEMAKMKAEFKRLHQFLEDREKILLAQVEELKKEIVRKRQEHLARFSEELSSLEGLIQEMEKKRQQPPSELLQDIGSLLQKSEKKETSENSVTFLPELKWKIWDFCDINPLLEGVMNQFKDALLHGLRLQKANITLDPETAHPKLIVSEDRKRVTCGDEKDCLDDNPQRFDTGLIVLGKERFTAGRYFWEVVVESKEQWMAGVTRESVKRKGTVVWSPKGGILAVGKWSGRYRATSQPKFTCFSPGDDLKRIRVSLNCAAGQVAFYNADTAARLYTFSEASFVGETFRPLFLVRGEACITISP